MKPVVHLLTAPEDAIHIGELSDHGTEGRDACRAALRELRDHRYVRQWREKYLNEQKKMVFVTVTEVGDTPLPGKCPAHPGTCGPVSTGSATPPTPQEPRSPLLATATTGRGEKTSSSLSSGVAGRVATGWQTKAKTPSRREMAKGVTADLQPSPPCGSRPPTSGPREGLGNLWGGPDGPEGHAVRLVGLLTYSWDSGRR